MLYALALKCVSNFVEHSFTRGASWLETSLICLIIDGTNSDKLFWFIISFSQVRCGTSQLQAGLLLRNHCLIPPSATCWFITTAKSNPQGETIKRLFLFSLGSTNLSYQHIQCTHQQKELCKDVSHMLHKFGQTLQTSLRAQAHHLCWHIDWA